VLKQAGVARLGVWLFVQLERVTVRDADVSGSRDGATPARTITRACYPECSYGGRPPGTAPKRLLVLRVPGLADLRLPLSCLAVMEKVVERRERMHQGGGQAQTGRRRRINTAAAGCSVYRGASILECGLPSSALHAEHLVSWEYS